jgi:Clp amino terminal domain, pathogenicity island component
MPICSKQTRIEFCLNVNWKEALQYRCEHVTPEHLLLGILVNELC